jgi:hypothetical protein
MCVRAFFSAPWYTYSIQMDSRQGALKKKVVCIFFQKNLKKSRPFYFLFLNSPCHKAVKNVI